MSVIILIFCVTFTVCAEEESPILATVNGTTITQADFDLMIENIPPDYVLYEPEGGIGGIGFPCGNSKLVSHDILRYQQVVNTLYHYGIISSLANTDEQKKLVLEIGAGYGGMAHSLLNILENEIAHPTVQRV